MSTPTPEDRARAVVADRSPVVVPAGQLVVTCTFVKADLEARVAAAIREAVALETQRCAALADRPIPPPECA